MWWSTLNGGPIRVAQMSTSHILNAIDWLTRDNEMGDEKDGAYVRTWILTFTAELKRRNGV
jgi:hypothetical protein